MICKVERAERSKSFCVLNTRRERTGNYHSHETYGQFRKITVKITFTSQFHLLNYLKISSWTYNPLMNASNLGLI